jgi:hypothetical protein
MERMSTEIQLAMILVGKRAGWDVFRKALGMLHYRGFLPQEGDPCNSGGSFSEPPKKDEPISRNGQETSNDRLHFVVPTE